MFLLKFIYLFIYLFIFFFVILLLDRYELSENLWWEEVNPEKIILGAPQGHMTPKWKIA